MKSQHGYRDWQVLISFRWCMMNKHNSHFVYCTCRICLWFDPVFVSGTARMPGRLHRSLKIKLQLLLFWWKSNELRQIEHRIPEKSWKMDLVKKKKKLKHIINHNMLVVLNYNWVTDLRNRLDPDLQTDLFDNIAGGRKREEIFLFLRRRFWFCDAIVFPLTRCCQMHVCPEESGVTYQKTLLTRKTKS